MKTQIINQTLPVLNQYGFKNMTLEVLLSHSNISSEEFHSDFTGFDHFFVEVFEQFCNEIDEVSSGIDQPEAKLYSFYQHCVSSLEIQQKYSFIFLDFYYLTTEIPEVKDRYFEMLRLRKSQLSHFFQYLEQKGIFKKESFPGQFEYLINQIVVITGFWPTHSQVVFGNFNIKYYSKLTFSLVIPYFTEVGLEEYRTHSDKGNFF